MLARTGEFQQLSPLAYTDSVLIEICPLKNKQQGSGQKDCVKKQTTYYDGVNCSTD